MPRLSFSVLSLYPIPSNRPPLPTSPSKRLFYLSLPPSLSLHPSLNPSNRAISIPLGLAAPLAPLCQYGDVSQVRQNLISTRIARQNRLPRLARRLFLYARSFRSNFRMKIIAHRFRKRELRFLPPFYRLFSRSWSVSFFPLVPIRERIKEIVGIYSFVGNICLLRVRINVYNMIREENLF